MSTRVPILMAVAVLLLTGCGATKSTSADSRISSLAPVPPGSVEEIEVEILGEEPPSGKEMAVQEFARATAALRGPHFAVGLSWVATGEAILPGSSLVIQSGLPPRRPATDGEEIMLLSFDPEHVGGQWKLGDGAKPVAELVVGGTPRPLTKVPLPAADATGLSGPVVIVVASVPKGAPVQLRVTELGRTQTLDVRTGKRGEDAIAGYYRPTRQKLNFERDLPAGIVADGRPYQPELKLIDSAFSDLSEPTAMLAPWNPTDGWAPDGRAWLVLPSPILSGEAFGGPTLELAIDEPTSFRVRLPDGTEIAERGGTQEVNLRTASLSKAPAPVLFDVPADVTTGTYLIDLNPVRITARYSNATLPARWQPAPPLVEVPLAIGT